MCSDGDACSYCIKPAILEAFWNRGWAAKLCEDHAKLIVEVPPDSTIFYDLKGPAN